MIHKLKNKDQTLRAYAGEPPLPDDGTEPKLYVRPPPTIKPETKKSDKLISSK